MELGVRSAVVETFAIVVVAVRVRTPVEETKVRRSEDDAPPPVWPKRSWDSTPEDKEKFVEVAYLLPRESTSVMMVDEAMRSSDDDTKLMEVVAVRVKSPVEVLKVKAALELAPPPEMPKSTCESTPELKVKFVVVAYFVPWKS